PTAGWCHGAHRRGTDATVRVARRLRAGPRSRLDRRRRRPAAHRHAGGPRPALPLPQPVLADLERSRSRPPISGGRGAPVDPPRIGREDRPIALSQILPAYDPHRSAPSAAAGARSLFLPLWLIAVGLFLMERRIVMRSTVR